MRPHKYIIGIDEAGRGPIAGPVSVGAVLLPISLDWRNFKGLRDSKKLTQNAREMWLSKLDNMDVAHYAVSFTSHSIIDRDGIVSSVHKAIHRSLSSLLLNTSIGMDECRVLLDGGLRAPKNFVNQETIIRGDEKEYAIALASVAAKVYRDKRMISLSKKYPEYNFHRHKGYGTKDHYMKIKAHGISDIHRRSFLSRL